MSNLFKYTMSKLELHWPFRYILLKKSHAKYIKILQKRIKVHPTKIRNLQFILNVFALLPQKWFYTLEKIIQLILSKKIFPNRAKKNSLIIIPKNSYVLEVTSGYPQYIKAYRKVISCDKMALTKLEIMEDLHQN